MYISWQVSNSSFECRIRSRNLGHAHLGVVLWSERSRGPSSMSVPNLKRIALFVQKLLGGVTVSARFMMEEDYTDILFQHHLMTLYLTETQIFHLTETHI